jgi:hypothetical protein
MFVIGGTFQTRRGSLMMSAPGGRTDLADMTADFRERPRLCENPIDAMVLLLSRRGK